jgi:hypothetical protein
MVTAASLAWAIAAGYWGVHLAVEPAISAYETCLRRSEPAICDHTLHQDWSDYSGSRVYFGTFLALAPLPFFWLIAYGVRRRKT